MTRTIWLCLRCGWRTAIQPDMSDRDRLEQHETRCGYHAVIRTVDAHGRITGGPRGRQP